MLHRNEQGPLADNGHSDQGRGPAGQQSSRVPWFLPPPRVPHLHSSSQPGDGQGRAQLPSPWEAVGAGGPGGQGPAEAAFSPRHTPLTTPAQHFGARRCPLDTPQDRGKKRAAGEPWGRGGEEGGRAEPPGWQEARRAGPASANAQESHAGRHTQQAHGGGRLQEILIFFSAFLYFTNSLPPTEAFCNQKKKSLAEQGELLVRQGDHTTAEGPLSPPTGLGDPWDAPAPATPAAPAVRWGHSW